MRQPLPVPAATLRAMVPFAEDYLRAQAALQAAVSAVAGMLPGLDPESVHYDPVTRSFSHEPPEPPVHASE